MTLASHFAENSGPEMLRPETANLSTWKAGISGRRTSHVMMLTTHVMMIRIIIIARKPRTKAEPLPAPPPLAVVVE